MNIFPNFVLVFVLVISPIVVNGQGSLYDRIEWMDSFFQKKHGLNRDSVITTLRQQLATAHDSDDQVQIALTGKELGLILIAIPDYNEAMTHLIRSLEIEDSLSFAKEKVITYLAMAKVFREVSNYPKSAEILSYAADLSKPFDDVNALVYILNELGTINAMRGNTDEALENYNLVLSHKGSFSSDKPEADALYNLGRLLTTKGDFANALDRHKKALTIRRKMGDKIREAQSLNEIGELYRRMKNIDKAFANHLVALQIRTKLNDLEGLAESYNYIGALYYEQKNLPRAIANLRLALDASNATQSAEASAMSYEYLSLCYKESGDFQNALKARESYADIIEMMRSEKAENELLEKENRHVLEKKETKIRQMADVQRERDLKIEAQKKTQDILLVLIGFGVIIILLVFYLYLVKRRINKTLEAAHARVNQQNQELQNLNATKDKFFSIISHDLKGPLNSFTAFSGMLINHTDDLSKEEIQMLAKEIDKNLKNLLALLENLLEWARSQTGSIEFKPEIFDLNDLLKQNQELLATQARNKKIELRYAPGYAAIVNAHKHSVNTVIRNLISNAIKFTPEGGVIAICVKEQGRNAMVSVSDTGVGMSKETLQKLFRIDTKYSTNGTANEKGTGLGLILCKDFIEKNGGNIGVDSEPGKGSVFYFTLPEVAEPAKTDIAPVVYAKSKTA